MRAERKKRSLLALAVVTVSSLLVGCQIPGGPFGHEPLQTRFAELTRRAIKAEAEQVPAIRYESSPRMTSAEPVVLAGTATTQKSL